MQSLIDFIVDYPRRALAIVGVVLLSVLIGFAVNTGIKRHQVWLSLDKETQAQVEKFNHEIRTLQPGDFVNFNNQAYVLEKWDSANTVILEGGPGTDRNKISVCVLNFEQLLDKDNQCRDVSTICRAENKLGWEQNATWFFLQ